MRTYMKHLCRKKLHELTPGNTCSSGRCKACKALWYKNNKDKVRANNTAWRLSHLDRIKTMSKSYY